MQKLAGITDNLKYGNSELIDWLGGAGLGTPEMSGIEGMKAHLLTSLDAEIPAIQNLPEAVADFILAASIDNLTLDQLILLRLSQYEGTSMDEVPEAVKKFSTDSEWLEVDPREVEQVLDVVEKAVNYYKEEDFSTSELSPWVLDLYTNKVKQFMSGHSKK